MKPRSPVIRGIAALSIFLFAFLVTMVVAFIMRFIVLIEVAGYDMFSWGSNPVPD